MASIYNKNGEYLTQGLQGSKVCDEAIKVAKRMAKNRNEEVYLEDDGWIYAILPDGSFGEVPDWMVETEAN